MNIHKDYARNLSSVREQRERERALRENMILCIGGFSLVAGVYARAPRLILSLSSTLLTRPALVVLRALSNLFVLIMHTYTYL